MGVFAPPSSDGQQLFTLSDFDGEIVVFEFTGEIIEEFSLPKTTHPPRRAGIADIVVVTGSRAGEKLSAHAVTASIIIKKMQNAGPGNPIVGRLWKGDRAWLLNERLSSDELALAEAAYLGNSPAAAPAAAAPVDADAPPFKL